MEELQRVSCAPMRDSARNLSRQNPKAEGAYPLALGQPMSNYCEDTLVASDGVSVLGSGAWSLGMTGLLGKLFNPDAPQGPNSTRTFD